MIWRERSFQFPQTRKPSRSNTTAKFEKRAKALSRFMKDGFSRKIKSHTPVQPAHAWHCRTRKKPHILGAAGLAHTWNDTFGTYMEQKLKTVVVVVVVVVKIRRNA